MFNRTASSRRRVAIVSLAGALALLAVSCGSDDDSSTSGTTAAPAGTTAAPAGGTTAAPGAAKPKLAIVYSAEFKDGSWGEAALIGGQRLLDAGVISDFKYQENVAPGADAERALRDYAKEGFNPIVAHSFNYGDDVKKVAKDFPDTIFVYAGGFGDVAGNVGDYSQPFYQATYLSGILAAGVKDGKVAGAGGFDIPVCRAMFNAFLAGAQTVKPATTGSFVAVGDWVDVQKAKEAALAQADGGATMFVGCGQGPTFGQIEAAKERNGVATGYVGDMSNRGDSVLTSFVWELDKVFAQIVEDVAAGKKEARYYEVPLKDGGMSVVVNPAWKDKIPAEVMAKFDEALKGIQAGTLEVPFSDK